MDLRINETRQTGAVRKPYLPGCESVYLFLAFTIIRVICVILLIRDSDNYRPAPIRSGFKATCLLTFGVILEIIVDLGINETLQIGAVGNSAYRVGLNAVRFLTAPTGPDKIGIQSNVPTNLWCYFRD